MKELKMIVEIPKGSSIKYEYNRKNDQIEVDRILRDGYIYPVNYGFIPNTLDWDGDELDVLVYSEETFVPGSILNIRIIGGMKMIDDGETDTKLIAVHADDYRLESITTIEDLPKKWLQTIETFFTTYKNWKEPGITSVLGFEEQRWANEELNECYELHSKYSLMSKKDFIAKMKTERPEKYVTKKLGE